MVHLLVDRSGAAPDLTEPLVFRNVFLQRMIEQRFTFHRTLCKKLRNIQVLALEMKSQSGSGLTFTASSSRENLPHP